MGRKKNFKIRSGARTTSKAQQKQLIKKAKALRKDPDLILPECQGKCFRCPFNKVRRSLYKISDKSDNERFLESRSNKGDPISRAYAATLTLIHTKKAPFLGRLRTPQGEVGYVFRGKAKKEKLIGVQYYDNPFWRMFLVADIVKKKKLHMYSSKDKMYCTGKVADPPEEFVKETLKSLKVDLRKHKHLYTCKHLDPKDVLNENPVQYPYILVKWISGEVTVAACHNCVKSKKEFLFGSLGKFIADKDIKRDFDVSVFSKPVCRSKCKKCIVEEVYEVDEDLLEDYKNAEIIDDGLITKYIEDLKKAYKRGRGIKFIAEGVCYGEAKEEFLKAMNPSLEEERAIKLILDEIKDPIIMDRATTSRFLSEYWDVYKEEALVEISKDKKFVKEMLADETRSLSPNQMIREANIHYNVENILSKLPTFEKMSPVARFADEVGRVFMAKGDEETERYIEKNRGTQTKVNKIAAALLFALNREGRKWQFTSAEGDFGMHIKPIAKKFLESTPKNYKRNLQKLISSTGSTEKIVVMKP
jgi:hypothetical protein